MKSYFEIKMKRGQIVIWHLWPNAHIQPNVLHHLTCEFRINHCEVSQMFINFVVKQEFPPNVHWFYIGSRKK